MLFSKTILVGLSLIAGWLVEYGSFNASISEIYWGLYHLSIQTADILEAMLSLYNHVVKYTPKLSNIVFFP